LSDGDPGRSGSVSVARGWHYGWTIVGAGVLCSALSSPGQSFILSLYIEPLIDELPVTRVGMATLYGGCTLAAAACLPFVGRLSDRTNARKFLTGVLLLLAAAMALLASVRGVVVLALALFALRLLGQGAIALGTATSTARWFVRHRARALAIVTLGYAMGELLFPGSVLAAMAWLGWRGSLLLLAAIYVVVFAPLIAWFTRDPLPGEPLGANADGSEARAGERTRSGRWIMSPNFTMSEAIRMPVFWIALGALAVMPMVLTGVIFHQVAIFAWAGWSAASIAAAFVAFALLGVAGNLTAGLTLDRIDPRWGIAASSLTAVVALIVASTGLRGAGGPLLYGGLLGLANGVAGGTNAIIWPSYFGIAALGEIKGVVNAVRNGSTALGPALVAGLITTEGSAAPAIATVALVLMLAAVGVFLMRAPGERRAGGS
jgi:MFS family permease